MVNFLQFLIAMTVISALVHASVARYRDQKINYWTSLIFASAGILLAFVQIGETVYDALS